MNQTTTTIETPTTAIQSIFQEQNANKFNIGNTNLSQRKAKLKALHQAILKYRPQIKEALYQDYKKHPSEVDLTEIYPITSELKHTIGSLRKWMAPQHVDTSLAFLGSSSYIHYEPKGVVLIISPWNFPFNLTFCPLISAIAAGNAVMIKPSEMTPHSSALMKKIISELFPANEVALVEGGVDTSKALLELPFDHIFFTGSPAVGKVVMTAAAKNLTSATLELGGKSPSIIDETANIDTAARRTAWGKCVNNGQICISPDYVFVHESKADEFVKKLGKYMQEFYEGDAAKNSSYARIVNKRHFNKVLNYLEDAVKKGAKISSGGQVDEQQNFIAPTILTQVPEDTEVMRNEIFGPLLPVFTFKDLNEVVQRVNAKEKPLALYIFSSSQKNINFLMANTRAGGTSINHNAVHFYNNNLPFGGVNNSGIGKGHGWYGFQAFSNARGVLKQHVPNALELLVPPYNSFKQKLIDLTIKYF
jgi:aldehyde dehydrogenase (NAD+)